MNPTEAQQAIKLLLSKAGTLPAFSLSILMLLGGCASTPNEETGFDKVTVKPGQTASCETRPCKIMFEVPAGSGTVEVTGNQTRLGDYPAGQTSEVGSFWQSQEIEIKGSDLPAAYVNIPMH